MGEECDEQQQAQTNAAPQEGAAPKRWLVIVYRHE
jgi:hypothetical protein